MRFYSKNYARYFFPELKEKKRKFLIKRLFSGRPFRATKPYYKYINSTYFKGWKSRRGKKRPLGGLLFDAIIYKDVQKYMKEKYK